MELICGLLQQQRPLALAIGNYDGVHLGHRHVLAKLAAAARERSIACAVLTFEPHPLELLRPRNAPPRIDDLRTKARKLAAEGVDALIIARFRPALAQLGPPEFARLLATRLRAAYVVVGADFRFGKGRSGDADDLQRLGRGSFTVETAEDFLSAGRRVSSGFVRECLAAGDFGRAAELLGEEYELAGRVVAGAGMGRQLGVPTANIRRRHPPPLDGVYAARVSAGGAAGMPAALSVGTRVAAGGTALAIEVHVLDYDGDLYGQRLRIWPQRFLRSQRDFPDLAQLSRAMEEDLAACRAVLPVG